jgi:hypothetical protein
VSVGNTPGFDVEFDGFAKAGAGALDIFSLRSDVQLWAARNIPAVFLGNQRGESVRHKPMLADVNTASKALQQSIFISHKLLVMRTHGRRNK